MRIILRLIIIALLFESVLWGDGIEKKIPILCYHRFGDSINDSTTIKTSEFAKQLAWLQANNYSVISLDSAIKYLTGQIKTIPDRSVVITADDGHKSIYYEMAPLIKKHRIPATLFIYPSAISNTNYSMTWEQLRELENTKLFRVESHTYWHPNFKQEKKKLSSDEYEKFVDKQLAGSKQMLEKKMGHEVKYLAWAFGIYDYELITKAVQSGYIAAFTIEKRSAAKSDTLMTLPRSMVVSIYDMKIFKKIVSEDN
ncbi:MAG: polysaccharide deacetylase family protein [Sulfurovaceae bacterium]|nr:polysaccharide deacetylase family protein [Sulfurovaceae bacterium]